MSLYFNDTQRKWIDPLKNSIKKEGEGVLRGRNNSAKKSENLLATTPNK